MGYEFVYFIGAALLLGGLAWGAATYRKRRQNERMPGDRKTEQLYEKR